jgi:hypothetical protein
MNPKRIINSKKCEKRNCRMPEMTNGSLFIFKDLINPALLRMALVAEVVVAMKKLNIIRPSRR